ETLYGALPFESETGYAVLEPLPGTEAIASLDGQTVATRTADGRLTWYGFSLSAGFGDIGSPDILYGILRDTGIQAPVAMDGDHVIPVERESTMGTPLLFLFNIERQDANVYFSPRWNASTARDLLTGEGLPRDGEYFHIVVPQWGVAVISCE
ncbi:MAG: hypothetical protein OXK79_08260, partial [Chloroflexota bacterium]|nr:hypothetical protein [Chloroflexota bacterium]